jgi:hypothetical protein
MVQLSPIKERKTHLTIKEPKMTNVNVIPSVVDSLDNLEAECKTQEQGANKASEVMSDVKFYPKPTEAKIKELSVLYYAIDHLIVATPAKDNPMTNDGYNFWEWGLIESGGRSFPAPYKDVGYNWNNVAIALKPEYSATTNLLIWLEMLHGYASRPSIQCPMMTFQCNQAFEWIRSLSEGEYCSIVAQLRMKCNEDGAASRVIN